MAKKNADFIKSLSGKTVDFHAHFIDPSQLDEGLMNSVPTGFGKHTMNTNTDEFTLMLDPHQQIAQMDELGMDIHVITSCDVLVGRSWASSQRQVTLCQKTNDCAAKWVSLYPERYVGAIHLPLGNIPATASELRRGIELGLKVISLSTSWQGKYLGEAEFTPLWEEIHDSGLPVFIHPDGVRESWFQKYAMWNSLGQSIEETKFMSSMIYEGVMERYDSLKIVMAHGGGYMPHYMGRLDRNYWNKPKTAINISKKPSEYLKMFYYDTCVYEPSVLVNLAHIVGSEQLVMGGDFPVAGTDAADFLINTPLSLKELTEIGGKNALKLLGI